MPGVFAVTMNLVVFVQGRVRVTVVHRLAVGVGVCVVFVAGMIRVVGVATRIPQCGAPSPGPP